MCKRGVENEWINERKMGREGEERGRMKKKEKEKKRKRKRKRQRKIN